MGGASNLTYLLRYAGGPAPAGATSSSAARRPARRPGAPTTWAGSTTSRRPSPRCSPWCRGWSRTAATSPSSAPSSTSWSASRGRSSGVTFPASSASTAKGWTRLCRNAVDVLVALHDVDLDASGLAGFDRGDGYVRRQVEGWSGRYRRARTDDVGDFEATMAWLEAHQPDDRPHVLIHNDFRFDNLVLGPEDPTRVVGVLDWEMATVGDPLMDLASGSPTGCRPTTPRHSSPCAGSRRTPPACSPAPRSSSATPTLEGWGSPRGSGGSTRCSGLPAGRHRPADLLPVPPRPDDATRHTVSSARSSASSTTRCAALVGAAS